jgi:hypothetical protein
LQFAFFRLPVIPLAIPYWSYETYCQQKKKRARPADSSFKNRPCLALLVSVSDNLPTVVGFDSNANPIAPMFHDAGVELRPANR